MRGRLKRRSPRGLTLLELVIAVLVLSLGSLAAIRATDQSRVAIGGMPSRVMAGIVARNRIQELQLYGATKAGTLPAQVEMGGRLFQVHTETEATSGRLVRVAVTARGPDGPGAYLVAYLIVEGGSP